jgi:hypothetical protein
MSWGAQNRSKDAKTPSTPRGRSENPEPDCCPVQPQDIFSYFLFLAPKLHALSYMLSPLCRPVNAWAVNLFLPNLGFGRLVV